MSGSRRRCCCCNETCPPGAYCTACGQTTDEAATWQVVITGFGTINLPCNPSADGSPINGTWGMPYLSTTTHSASPLNVECFYDPGANFHTFALNSFGGGGTCDDVVPFYFETLILSVRYTVVSACVCATSIDLSGSVRLDASNAITISHGWSFSRAIDCSETFDETTGSPGFGGYNAQSSGGGSYLVGLAVSKL